MISYRKAKALLEPGDVVYMVDGHRVYEHEVLKILPDCLKVADGWLYFDEHGFNWFLHPTMAAQAAQRGV